MPVPFYKGATWSFTFAFVDEITEDPYDLTGTGPFVMTVRKVGCNSLLAEVEGVGDYDDDGLVSFQILSSSTTNFPLGKVMVSVRDNADLPLVADLVQVLPFA